MNEKEEEKARRTPQSDQTYQTLNLELKNLKNQSMLLNKNFTESELASTKDSIAKINSQLNSIRSNCQTLILKRCLMIKLSEGTLTPAIKDKVLEISNFMQAQNFSEDFSPEVFSLM